MQDFIKELKARRVEITKRMKDLEKYIREIQRLDNELRHIDALLHIHTKDPDKYESSTGQTPYINILYDHNKKFPSGIARHIMAVFMDNNVPLPIHEIDKQLRARDVEVTPSGINTALRRNPDYFEQVEKGKWQLKKSQVPPSEEKDTEAFSRKTAKSEAVGVG